MKIVIEITENYYKACKEWHKNKMATVEQILIANGKPYEERPQGEWKETGYETGALGIIYRQTQCSNCGWEHALPVWYKFCPNCGAEMKGGQKND